MKILITALTAITLMTIQPAQAESTGHNAMQHEHGMDMSSMNDDGMAMEMTDGEVRKVDKSAGKITLKHGPLPNLGMGAMTMVFRAKDPALLNQLKAGDRIRFRAESVNGALTITEAEKTP